MFCRTVCFALLALFNGHLGILRLPLDSMSFKVNLSQRLYTNTCGRGLNRVDTLRSFTGIRIKLIEIWDPRLANFLRIDMAY